MNKTGYIICVTILAIPMLFGVWFACNFVRTDDYDGEEAIRSLRHSFGITAHYRCGVTLEAADSFPLPVGVNTVQERCFRAGPNGESWYRFNANPEDIAALIAACALTETGTVAPYEGYMDFQ